MSDGELNISLSAIQTYRTCEQRYAYQYVAGLQRRGASPAPTLGSVLHCYLEYYYRGLKQGMLCDESHEASIVETRERWGPKLDEYVAIASIFGAVQDVDAFSSMLARAERMMGRYFRIHGRRDAEQYDVVLIEQPIKAITVKDPRIVSRGYADLVTKDRNTGKVLLWEHKSTKNIPSHEYRLRDLQTTLYIAQLRLYGVEATGVLWNYLRTADPRVPSPLKSGKMSLAAIDTTWDVYEDALRAYGLDPADYAEMRERLLTRELDEYYPRYEIMKSTGTEMLIRDYKASARALHADIAAWESGARKPVRQLSRDCDYCDFARLCTALLSGRESEQIAMQGYTTREQRRGGALPQRS